MQASDVFGFSADRLGGVFGTTWQCRYFVIHIQQQVIVRWASEADAIAQSDFAKGEIEYVSVSISDIPNNELEIKDKKGCIHTIRIMEGEMTSVLKQFTPEQGGTKGQVCLTPVDRTGKSTTLMTTGMMRVTPSDHIEGGQKEQVRLTPVDRTKKSTATMLSTSGKFKPMISATSTPLQKTAAKNEGDC
jgi:hypothetical protein